MVFMVKSENVLLPEEEAKIEAKGLSSSALQDLLTVSHWLSDSIQ